MNAKTRLIFLGAILAVASVIGVLFFGNDDKEEARVTSDGGLSTTLAFRETIKEVRTQDGYILLVLENGAEVVLDPDKQYSVKIDSIGAGMKVYIRAEATDGPATVEYLNLANITPPTGCGVHRCITPPNIQCRPPTEARAGCGREVITNSTL